MDPTRLSPSARLQEYLGSIQRRLRLSVASRGIGATAAAALLLTLIFVFIANRFAFSESSVFSSRTLLYGSVLAVIVWALLRPLLKLGGKSTAGHIEKSVPAFDGRVETFVDETAETQQSGEKANPFLDLLAEDTLRVAEMAPAEQVVSPRRIASYAGVGLVALLALIWLGSYGPGYWGYGVSSLWGGWLRPVNSPLYQIVVQPGGATVVQGADLVVTAQMIGFDSPTAQLFAKYASGVEWEEAPMQNQFEGSGFEFLFAGVREPFRYYISSGGIRSEEFEVEVVEMPVLKNIRLNYDYPDWTGLEDQIEDPGGDIRAVEGTKVEVEVETDKPLQGGVLQVGDGKTLQMTSDGLRSRGSIEVQGDSQYFVAALYNGEAVRLSDDFFITIVPDNKPTISVVRPGRDYRASNLEEVVTQFKAGDDFGLKSLALHYSVNGGEAERVPLRITAGAKEARSSHTLYLEDLGGEGVANLVPGDLIAYYAVAKDNKHSTQTDMYFVEVQPYDREFYQSQQAGGGGMGGGEQRQDEISRRQKEILAATWNLIKKSQNASAAEKAEIRDNAIVLSDIQLTLRDQARTLVERVKARQLAGTNKKFAEFVENLEQAAQFMEPASEKLSAQKLRESIPYQQKALQFLLRAEAVFREIQLAFGQGGGGGGGQAQLDLAEMFELEMDLHKNQYETGGGSSAQQLDREIDEALEKLKELAQRQEKLAEQRRRQETPTFAQRWQQEMLRREAMELKRQMEQLQRRQQAQQQSGQQQSGQQQSGQQQSGQQSGQAGSGSSSQTNLQRIIERLDQATREMQSDPSGNQQAGSSAGGEAADEARARRAQERLEQALRQLSQERRQQVTSALGDIAQRAAQLAEEQERIAQRLREDMRQAIEKLKLQDPNNRRRVRLSSSLSAEEALKLAEGKSAMQEELEGIERRMQEAIRGLGQNPASDKLRQALGDLQQAEVATQLGRAAEYIRRGYAPYAAQAEEGVTRALSELREQTREAERLARAGGEGREEGLERSLARLENLRRQMEQAAGLGQDPARRAGQQPGQGQQGQQQQGSGQQPGDQQGQQGQQGQQSGQGQQAGQQGQQGQQGGQGQQAGQSQQGQSQQGQGQQGGNQRGGGGGEQTGGEYAWGGPWGGPQRRFGSASNYGNGMRPDAPGPWDPETRRAMEQALREGARLVPNLTRELRAGGIYQEDLEEIRRFVRNLPNSRFQGNPQLLAEEYRKMLALLEQLELQVRRQVEEEDGSQIRAIVTEPVPEQYREAVAEYFRKLGSGK